MKAVQLHRKQVLERLLKYPLQQLQRNECTNGLYSWRKKQCESRDRVIMQGLKKFPNASVIHRQCIQFNWDDLLFKNSLLNELLSEFDVNTSLFSLHGMESEYILNVNVEILKKHGLLNSILIDKLVNYLESFPYKEPVLNSPLTINNIRNSIEEQYLAWKLGEDLNLVRYILKRLHPCVYVGRSLKNVKSTLAELEKKKFRHFKNISYLLYLMNMRSFNLEDIIKCPKNLLDVPWDQAAVLFPKLMMNPYSYVMLIISILQKEKFSGSQILKGLPFVTNNISNFLVRLDFLLSSPALSSYRNREDFLVLLYYHHTRLMEKVTSSQNDPNLMESLFEVNISRRRRDQSVQHLHYKLHKSLNISEQIFLNLRRHPQFRTFREDNVVDTLNYLLEKGFTKEEILESITILLYSRDKIEASLKKIKEEKDSLAEFGFEDGRVSEETTTFARGTKLKNKTLQLSLYFMEKDYDFSGQGVYSRSTDGDDSNIIK